MVAGILAPGECSTFRRNAETEFPVRDHVDPRMRCRLAPGKTDDTFASVPREAAISIPERQVGAVGGRRSGLFAPHPRDQRGIAPLAENGWRARNRQRVLQL